MFGPSTIPCPCGGTMRKKVKYTGGGCRGVVAAVLCLCIGLALCFIPIIGWVLGPLLCICAPFLMFGKARKVWRCRRCRRMNDRG